MRGRLSWEKALGPHHPNVATGLGNLATLYHDMGEHEKAEPLLERALTIREITLGLDHPLVAQSFNNLGALPERSPHSRRIARVA
jgi:hypothetical protein